MAAREYSGLVGWLLLSSELEDVILFSLNSLSNFWDWSLITGRGATKQEGGASEVLPLQKGGSGKGFSHAEVGGGAQTVLR